MKKMILLLLTIALLLSTSVSAFATESSVSKSQDVTATYTELPAGATVISVAIEWEGMDFTYQGAQKTWDADAHQYVEKEGAWAEGVGTITIANHSDMILQAKLDYTQAEDYEDIQMHFTDKNPYIGSAYTKENEGGEECIVQVQAVPVGDMEKPENAKATIGTIQVTVDAGPDTSSVFGHIVDAYGKVSVSDGTDVDRGVVYYASGDVTAIEEACETASGFLGFGGADENAALNSLITAYYNAMKIGQ